MARAETYSHRRLVLMNSTLRGMNCDASSTLASKGRALEIEPQIGGWEGHKHMIHDDSKNYPKVWKPIFV